jgi:hypothetical protein
MVTSVRFSGPNSKDSPSRRSAADYPKPPPPLERQDAFRIDEETVGMTDSSGDSFKKLPEKSSSLKRALTDANDAPPPKRVRFEIEQLTPSHSKRPLSVDAAEDTLTVNAPSKRAKLPETHNQGDKTQKLFNLLQNDRLETQQLGEVNALLRGRTKPDVQAKDRSGNTLLHIAAKNGHADAVESLLDAGADIRAKNKLGYTALHEAAWHGQDAVVQALLNANADINAEDKFGTTALHNAAWQGHANAVQNLLNAGADARAKDAVGTTPLALAKWQGHKEIIRLLEEPVRKEQTDAASSAPEREGLENS